MPLISNSQKTGQKENTYPPTCTLFIWETRLACIETDTYVLCGPVSWVVSWIFMKFFMSNIIRARHTQTQHYHNQTERKGLYLYGSMKQNYWTKSVCFNTTPRNRERNSLQSTPKSLKKKLGSQKSNTIKVKIRNNLHWQQYHHFLLYRLKGF